MSTNSARAHTTSALASGHGSSKRLRATHAKADEVAETEASREAPHALRAREAGACGRERVGRAAAAALARALADDDLDLLHGLLTESLQELKWFRKARFLFSILYGR